MDTPPKHPALKECLERWDLTLTDLPEDPALWESFLRDLDHALYSMHHHGGVILDKNFDRIVTHAVDAFIIHDTRGQVLAFNQAACDMLGYNTEELQALNVADFETELEPGAFWEDMHVDQVFTVEGVHRRKDGSTYPVETRVGAFMLDEKKVCLAVCRDISQRKRDAAVLKVTNKNLEAANEAVRRATLAHRQTVAGMNFELRTPLSAVLGYTELLLEEMNAREEEHYLEDVERIRSAGQELLALLDKMIDTADLEEQTNQLDIQEFSLPALLDEIDRIARPLAQRQHNQLVVEVLDECQHTMVRSDLTKIRQILMNLLENACRVTHRGEVILRAGCMGAHENIVFEVHDTGPGMSAQELAQFLSPVDPLVLAQRDPADAGMGLTLTRHLCELLGGNIQVTSQPGVGTIFLATLPIVCDTDHPTTA